MKARSSLIPAPENSPDKILAEIQRLSTKPIRNIANTSFHPAYTGGNEKLKNAGSDPSVVGTFLALELRVRAPRPDHFP